MEFLLKMEKMRNWKIKLFFQFKNGGNWKKWPKLVKTGKFSKKLEKLVEKWKIQ